MAESPITVTPAQLVIGGAGASYEEMIAHEANAVGDWVYKDTDSEAALADNSTAVKAALHGIVTGAAAAAGQKCVVQKGGEPTLGAGAAPVQGTIYVISATPGKIMPAAGLAAGVFVSVAGVGSGSNKLKTRIVNSGVAVPT